MKAIVLFRDRVTYAKQCVKALQESNLEVIIVDHNSTWPEAKNWLSEVDVDVFSLDFNHPYDLWRTKLVSELVTENESYIVTDPDCVVTAPDDWVEYLAAVLAYNRGYRKVGLGLRLDDIPSGYFYRNEVIRWENQLYQQELNPNVYVCDTDTTIAMYQPLSIFDSFAATPSLRTQGLYKARHLTWYETECTEEIAHYRKKIVDGLTHWSA